MGRHSSSAWSAFAGGNGARSHRGLAVGLVCAIALVIATVVVAWQLQGKSSAHDAADGAPHSSAHETGCAKAEVLWTTPDYASAATKLVQQYSTAKGSTCSLLNVQTTSTRPSGSGLWLAPSAQLAASGSPGTVVASSPVVVAYPKPIATSMGWPGTSFNTPLLQGYLLNKASATKNWQPAWGAFRFVLPDPAKSAAGAVGYAALASVANGALLTSAPSVTNLTPAALATIRVEQAVSKTPADEFQALASATTLSSSIAATSGYVTTEFALQQHDADPKLLPLSGFYLLGGAAAVTLSAASIGSASGAGAGLISYLTGSAGGQLLHSVGLRSASGTAVSPALAGMPSTVESAPPAAVSAAQETSLIKIWNSQHLRTSTLALLDMSGSMNDTFPGSNISKADIVRQVIATIYQVVSPLSKSAVWTFNTPSDSQSPQINHVSNLALNGAMVSGGLTQGQYTAKTFASLQASGGTPLYQAVEAGYQNVLSNFDSSMYNQLLVLTDGQNGDSSSALTLPQTTAQLSALASRTKPVRTIFIGLGPDADMNALNAMAKATGGQAFQISALGDVAPVLQESVFTS